MRSKFAASTFVATAFAIAPALAVAHPGHLDDAPVAHAIAHGLFGILAAIALVLTVKARGKSICRAWIERVRLRR